MKIISRTAIKAFIETHPDSQSGLDAWYDLIRKGTFHGLNDLRTVFPKTDLVVRGFVFNISGNKYRLAASIHFKTQRVFIREIMTHAEYSKNAWKKRHKDFC